MQGGQVGCGAGAGEALWAARCQEWRGVSDSVDTGEKAGLKPEAWWTEPRVVLTGRGCTGCGHIAFEGLCTPLCPTNMALND